MQRRLVHVAGVVAAVGMATAGVASVASADVLFSNRGTGPNSPDVFSSAINAPLVEDGSFTGPGPFDVSAINIGYDNTGIDPLNVDVLVSFWDTIDYNVSPITNPVNTAQIGGTYRFSILANPGADETGWLTIPDGPLGFLDADWGVMVSFVQTGTDIASPDINHLFRDVPIGVGSSDELFGYDFDNNTIIAGDELFTWQGDGFPPGNLYFEIQGSQAVPEPSAVFVAGMSALTLLRRRRT
jgi:hypothetical protein